MEAGEGVMSLADAPLQHSREPLGGELPRAAAASGLTAAVYLVYDKQILGAALCGVQGWKALNIMYDMYRLSLFVNLIVLL